MKPYSLVIFDLDGTLYRGDEPLSGAREVVAELRAGGTHVRFLTNNASASAKAAALKLQKMGIPAEPSEVYGVAMGAARYCREQGLRSVFVVGEPGLFQALQDAEIEAVNSYEEPLSRRISECVVAGICRSFTYGWLDAALQQLLAGASFIATNRDRLYPLEEGRFAPGAGGIVAAIEAASGQSPTVIGKPNPYLINLILQDAVVRPDEALVVGDQMETDIAAGHAAGCDTWLVLTGVDLQAPPGQPFGRQLSDLLNS